MPDKAVHRGTRPTRICNRLCSTTSPQPCANCSSIWWMPIDIALRFELSR